MAVDERRLTGKVLSYWCDLRGARSYPAPADLRPDAIPELWPFCFSIRADPEDDLTFDYFGEAIADWFGVDYAGSPVSALPSRVAEPAADYCRISASHEKPIAAGDIVLTPACDEIRYRSILLPFGDDKGGVTLLVGAINGRTEHLSIDEVLAGTQ